MIPVLYNKGTTQFTGNGVGRLPDCISCEVTEERNGIYECDFTYPTTGANFENITLGRIIGVTHDDGGEIQPFDIVSYSKPIDGIVTFHAVHMSYRLTKEVATASNVTSLATALSTLETASGDFYFTTDKTSGAYMAAFDGTPKTIRSLIGGEEGSLLDTYGGELEWYFNQVILHASRGKHSGFAIRYGVNMTDYTDETDYSASFTSCIPFWNGSDGLVIGARVDSGAPSYSGRTGAEDCVPLDLTESFEAQPTTAALEAEALRYMKEHQSNLPSQNITVNFVRLQDLGYEDLGALLKCNLCDTVDVIFPAYGMRGRYKVVRTVWNVLADRYEEMELGALKTTLSEALGVGQGSVTQVSSGGTEPKSAYRTAITFHTLGDTFTPTDDGVLVMIGRAGGSTGYIAIMDDTLNEYAAINHISTQSQYETVTTFLLSGHTYRVSGVTNWTSVNEAFFGFGGLVDADSLSW